MKEAFTVLFDSGIGGISLLKYLVEKMPNENFIYLSDNKNIPFGNKSNFQLERIVLDNVVPLENDFKIKSLVFACNTLSVSVRRNIEEKLKIKTYGVFPPVEKYLIKGEKVLLLATLKTIESFKKYKNLDYIGFENLAKDIENNAFNLKKVSLINNINSSINKFVDKKGYYDRVILGCTHYFFIKNEIFNHFCPQNISSGNEFTISFIANNKQSIKSLVKHKEKCVLFLGDNADINKKIYVSGG